MTDDELNHQLAAFAATQRGVVSRAQLTDLGFTPKQVQRRCEQALLHRLAPTTFAVGHVGLSRRAQGIATLLHTGPDSGLSHWTAARVWELWKTSTQAEIHVSVINRSPYAVPPGVKLHRPRTLTTADIVVHRGLRVTTPERTLTDLLPKLSVPETTRILEQMVTQLGRSPDDLHLWAARLSGVKGRAKLHEALDHVLGPPVLRSRLEERFRSLCQSARLPLGETNQRIAGWEFDVVWHRERVALELDSYRWHGGRWQFHRDRRKGLAASKAGYELLRASWPQLDAESSDVIDAVHAALARGASRLGSRY